MNKDDIQLLYEYNRWANHRVFRAASALSVEQFTRDLGGAFHSLRDTLVHIVAGEWAWLELERACSRCRVPHRFGGAPRCHIRSQ